MGQSTELISEFETILVRKRCPILAKLKVGLDSDLVSELLNMNDINSDILPVLYTWKNGIKDIENNVIGNMELFPDGIMLSLEEANNVYLIYTHQQDLWSKNFFPIFTNGGGDYLLFDLNSKSNTYEMIFLYAPALLLDEAPQTIYDSLDNLFATQIECLHKSAYGFDSNGISDIDYDLLYDISAKNNPKSRYWDDYR